MEVTMNISGANKTKDSAGHNAFDNGRVERIIRDSVLLRQKLTRVTDIKDKALADKAASDAALEAVRNELALARKTISDLKTQIAELTASLNETSAANTTKKQRKNKNVETEPLAEAESAD